MLAFEEAGKHGTVSIVESISVPTRASFCNYSDGILWVGDFYIPDNSSYSTPDERHMTNRVGKEYGAWCVGYRLTDSTESGFASTAWTSGMKYATPDIVVSIDQKIQGFAVVGDKIALSQSYGRTNNSTIWIYDNILDTQAHTTVTINEKSVPVWFLDSSIQSASYTSMPMSEGVAAYKGSLLILYESGAPYYKDGGGKNPVDCIFKMTLK